MAIVHQYWQLHLIHWRSLLVDILQLCAGAHGNSSAKTQRCLVIAPLGFYVLVWSWNFDIKRRNFMNRMNLPQIKSTLCEWSDVDEPSSPQFNANCWKQVHQQSSGNWHLYWLHVNTRWNISIVLTFFFLLYINKISISILKWRLFFLFSLNFFPLLVALITFIDLY